MRIFSTKLHILPKDSETHVSVNFDVPQGLKRLEVRTAYSPKYEYDLDRCFNLIESGLASQDAEKKFTLNEVQRCIPLANHIAWSLHDGQRWLGTEHRHAPDQRHIISEDFSSNGFVKTAVNGGRWTLTASINGLVTEYTDVIVEVDGYEESAAIEVSCEYGNADIVNNSREGERSWQRVEMHCHTVASDGDMQPLQLVQNAIKRDYKAICLTDHNTTSNVEETKKWGEKYGLVVCGGIEWSTFWGHITVVGGNSDIEWKDITPANINAKIIRARQLGDIVTIAHPKRIGSPLCMGCHNRFKITNWDYVTSYEVWSHYDPNLSPTNDKAKREWISLLDKGYRICALYGYDWHAPDEGGPSFAYTYLGIDGILSQESVLQAVEWGRSYITMGYEVDIYLDDGTHRYQIGDEVSVGRYKLTVKAIRCGGYQYDSKLQYINVRGSACQELTLDVTDGESICEMYLDKKGYIRIEGVGKMNDKDADVFIASPIYVKEE